LIKGHPVCSREAGMLHSKMKRTGQQLFWITTKSWTHSNRCATWQHSGTGRLHPPRCQTLPTSSKLVKLTPLHRQDTHAIRPVVIFHLPDSRPGPCEPLNTCLKVSSGIWGSLTHNLEAYDEGRIYWWQRTTFSRVLMYDITWTYTTTCWEYVLSDWILTESLPGPEGFNTVLSSARRTNESEVAVVRPAFFDVSLST